MLLLFSLQYTQLEELGYSGFAIAFKGEKMQVVSTSTADKCLTPALLDYLRSTIVAGTVLLCPFCTRND